jgi:phosphoribosylanthranilate isomerase
VLWPGSPRGVTVDAARAIAAALPPFVTTVGLFVDAAAGDVRRACTDVPLDVLQFHGAEPPEFCRRSDGPM